MTGAVRAVALAATWAWLTAGAVAAGSLPESVSPQVIPNYSLLRPDVAGSGAPTEKGMGQLRALGIDVVLDLRAPEEGTATEQAAILAAGLRYVSLPITPERFSAGDIARLAAILDDPGHGPVLVHCSTANRVGGVWMALQVTKGVPYDEAEAEGRRIGLRSAPMIAAVRRVVGGPPDR